MKRILVLHGAGMDMRGKTMIETFGPMKLPEYDEQIRGVAAELGVAVEIFHSNSEGAIIDKLYAAHDTNFDGAIINPAGFTRGYSALNAAISQVKFPVVEVHISNPARRGMVSEVGAVCVMTIAGFGVQGYELALRGLRDR